MNKKTPYLFAGALILGILLGRVFWHTPAGSAESPHASAESVEQPSVWTCSMHPQIMQPEPGDCPICGMDLIALSKDVGTDDAPRQMSMSEASRALADIQTTEVVRTYPEAPVRLVGKLEYDETREKSLTARFPARIDELYVNYTGIPVNKGEHLAKVYSPELLTAQRELISAYRADPNSSMARAAREKLRLWDLLPDQMDAILERGEPQDHFVLKAPIGGVVVSKQVKEGEYVKTGEPLFKIVDLSVLWADLDAYESDLPWLRYGQDVVFTVESFPGERFHGQIAFIEPEVDRKTRTVPIRVNVANKEHRLKPGMFVRAVVTSRLGEDGRVYAPEFEGKWISPMHPEVIKDAPGSCDVCGMDLVPAEELGYVENSKTSAPLVIPDSAVLRTGKRAVVYVEKPHAYRPTYEGREIVLGPRAGNHFLVVSGLEEGERIVTKGAFKIDSALQIQAQPSMMNPEAGASMPSHHQGDTREQTGSQMSALIEISAEQAAALMPSYLAMQAALANDNLDSAHAQVKAMMAITGHKGALSELIHNMLAAETIDALRKPHFETLSNALVAAAKKAPESMPENLMIMHCPMVYEDRGADWLQTSEPLQNPYYGAMMLRCGEIKSVIKDSEKEHDGHEH